MVIAGTDCLARAGVDDVAVVDDDVTGAGGRTVVLEGPVRGGIETGIAVDVADA